MSYFIEGLEVLGGFLLFGLFMILVACMLAMLPQKQHKMPRRTVWHDCPDEVVKIVQVPYDRDERYPFDQDAWEAKFADGRRVP